MIFLHNGTTRMKKLINYLPPFPELNLSIFITDERGLFKVEPQSMPFFMIKKKIIICLCEMYKGNDVTNFILFKALYDELK